MTRHINPTKAALQLLAIRPFLTKFYVCFSIPSLLSNQIAGPFDTIEEAKVRRGELAGYLDASFRNGIMNGMSELNFGQEG